MRVKQGKQRSFRNVLVKRKNLRVLRKLGLAITITVFAAILYTMIAGHTYEAKQRIQLEKTYSQLEKTQQQLLKTKATSADEQKQKDQQIQELNNQLKSTQQQLEAKRNSATVYAAPAPAPVAVSGCGDNFYKQFIYQHESGCSTAAINPSSGSCGLGQAWPCSKLPCSLSDWVCQDNFFNNYAIARYGSWEAAYYYWVSHRNW